MQGYVRHFDFFRTNQDGYFWSRSKTDSSTAWARPNVGQAGLTPPVNSDDRTFEPIVLDTRWGLVESEGRTDDVYERTLTSAVKVKRETRVMDITVRAPFALAHDEDYLWFRPVNGGLFYPGGRVEGLSPYSWPGGGKVYYHVIQVDDDGREVLLRGVDNLPALKSSS